MGICCSITRKHIEYVPCAICFGLKVESPETEPTLNPMTVTPTQYKIQSTGVRCVNCAGTGIGECVVMEMQFRYTCKGPYLYSYGVSNDQSALEYDTKTTAVTYRKNRQELLLRTARTAPHFAADPPPLILEPIIVIIPPQHFITPPPSPRTPYPSPV